MQAARGRDGYQRQRKKQACIERPLMRGRLHDSIVREEAWPGENFCEVVVLDLGKRCRVAEF